MGARGSLVIVMSALFFKSSVSAFLGQRSRLAPIGMRMHRFSQSHSLLRASKVKNQPCIRPIFSHNPFSSSVDAISRSRREMGQNQKIKVLDMFAKAKNFTAMMEFYENHEGELPNFAFPVMISVCHKAEHIEAAEHFLSEMRSRNMKVTEERLLVCLVRCYSNKNDVVKARNIIDTIDSPKLRTYLPVLESLCRKDDLDGIFEILDELKRHHLDYTDQVLTSVLTAFLGKKNEVSSDEILKLNAILQECKNSFFSITGMDAFSIISSYSSNSPSKGIQSFSILVESIGHLRSKLISHTEDGDVIWSQKMVINNDTNVNETLIYEPLHKDMNRSSTNSIMRPNKRLQLVNVSDSSCTCPNCGSKLERSILTDSERLKMREALMDVIESRHDKKAAQTKGLIQRVENFKTFQSWLGRRKEFTHIIDGANVAYHKQNCDGGGFSYIQIGAVVDKIESLDPKARCLIIMPSVYSSKDPIPNNVCRGSRSGRTKSERNMTTLTSVDKKLLQSWRQRDILYSVVAPSNDDWYWIYMAIGENRKQPAKIITNDKMRDHCFEFMESRPLWRMQSSQVYSFDFRRDDNFTSSVETLARDLVLYDPPLISKEIQSSDSHWHIPIEVNDIFGPVPKSNTTESSIYARNSENMWLCLRPVP
jgi:hypothetical protein